LELVNLRLDHIKAYNSLLHYKDTLYLARLWIKKWGKLSCNEISQQMIEKWVLHRAKVSPVTANKEIRHLRSLFNFGKKKKLLTVNPTDGVDFLPTEKRLKYVPSVEDIDKVIAATDRDGQDYLWTIRETLARVNEINKLTWDDVDLQNRFVVLYTRKKKGGHLTPRKVPMTETLHVVLTRRFEERDVTLPWVFWHKQYRQPFQNRNRLMGRLCAKAGVRAFGFHALRHAGASIMDTNNVPIGAIQRVLGHENRTTTEIYLHNIGNSERQAIDVYEQARTESNTRSNTQTEKHLQEIPVSA
jgi:integrase